MPRVDGNERGGYNIKKILGVCIFAATHFHLRLIATDIALQQEGIIWRRHLWGYYLKKVGLDAMILNGKCADRIWLKIANDSFIFHDANMFRCAVDMPMTFDTCIRCRERGYNPDCCLSARRALSKKREEIVWAKFIARSFRV